MSAFKKHERRQGICNILVSCHCVLHSADTTIHRIHHKQHVCYVQNIDSFYMVNTSIDSYFRIHPTRTVSVLVQ